jgi:acetyl-CoA/propionyl-CoA carboxylase carboxyl transferase subunit
MRSTPRGRPCRCWPGTAGAVDIAEEPRLRDVLPRRRQEAYDVRTVARLLLNDEPLELHAGWAPNLLTALGRLGGRTVGVLANNPVWLAGCLDTDASDKAARFVRMCDALGVPLVVLVDTPGYLPGVAEEHGGIVRRGAKLLHAFAEASVPWVTVLLHKAYGGAYIAMGSRSLGASGVLAWPDARIGVMGAEAAARVVHRRALLQVPEVARPAVVSVLAEEFAGDDAVERAVELGAVDAVIDPAATRVEVARRLAAAAPGRGRHGNIPL